MAVGDFAGIGNEMTLAEAWNGTTWSVVKMPAHSLEGCFSFQSPIAHRPRRSGRRGPVC
jgi:hypothetical protein